MLNREKHQLTMGNILRDIYGDSEIAPLLGFRGGTCAYFFYDLPRFSVDLDFDLLETDEKTQKLVFVKIKSIVEKYGRVKDSYIKHFTIFCLLSYGLTDQNIKVEINTRKPMPNLRKYFELRKYLGISMLVAKQDYMFGSKLAALTSRKETAMRDIYDVWYFGKNNWDFDVEVVLARTDKDIKTYLADCIVAVEAVKDNEILHGLGELVGGKEKVFIKNKLRQEVVFLLKNYQSVLK
ncbi:MAG TPA: nucleotidyl transferase AbiEii/AbiGii toxin family protein [Patescibacteria group bacterium]|nr:nucleotidyl transferase AbiEii/AbiGii toxin family protein [Patescibacteria group bacterium]